MCFERPFFYQYWSNDRDGQFEILVPFDSSFHGESNALYRIEKCFVVLEKTASMCFERPFFYQYWSNDRDGQFEILVPFDSSFHEESNALYRIEKCCVVLEKTASMCFERPSFYQYWSNDRDGQFEILVPFDSSFHGESNALYRIEKCFVLEKTASMSFESSSSDQYWSNDRDGRFEILVPFDSSFHGESNALFRIEKCSVVLEKTASMCFERSFFYQYWSNDRDGQFEILVPFDSSFHWESNALYRIEKCFVVLEKTASMCFERPFFYQYWSNDRDGQFEILVPFDSSFHGESNALYRIEKCCVVLEKTASMCFERPSFYQYWSNDRDGQFEILVPFDSSFHGESNALYRIEKCFVVLEKTASMCFERPSFYQYWSNDRDGQFEILVPFDSSFHGESNALYRIEKCFVVLEKTASMCFERSFFYQYWSNDRDGQFEILVPFDSSFHGESNALYRIEKCFVVLEKTASMCFERPFFYQYWSNDRDGQFEILVPFDSSFHEESNALYRIEKCCVVLEKTASMCFERPFFYQYWSNHRDGQFEILVPFDSSFHGESNALFRIEKCSVVLEKTASMCFERSFVLSILVKRPRWSI